MDILITHPEERKVSGLLPRLLKSLSSVDTLLCGRLEKSTYSDEVLTQDSKLSMRGQLDHFEKWIGIMKVPRKVRRSGDQVWGTKTASGRSDTEKGENIEVDADKEKVGKHRPERSENNGSNSCRKEAELFDEEISLDNVGSTETTNRQHQSDGRTVRDVAGSNQSFDLPSNVTGFDEDPEQTGREERDWIARRVDIIISPYSQYYYALVGWIGSKQFNRDIRTYADREMKMKLTSHGLYDFTLVSHRTFSCLYAPTHPLSTD